MPEIQPVPPMTDEEYEAGYHWIIEHADAAAARYAPVFRQLDLKWQIGSDVRVPTREEIKKEILVMAGGLPRKGDAPGSLPTNSAGQSRLPLNLKVSKFGQKVHAEIRFDDALSMSLLGGEL